MIFAIASAWADPVAVRAPLDASPVSIAIAPQQASVAAWGPHHVGGAVAATRGAVAALVGARRRLAGGATGWSCVVGGAVGPAWLFLDGDLGVATSVDVAVEHHWRGALVQLDLSAPVAARLTGGVDVAIPVQLELSAAWKPKVGPVSQLGVRLATGSTIAPGRPGSIDGHASVIASFGRRRQR
jgi:hypothetical protein